MGSLPKRTTTLLVILLVVTYILVKVKLSVAFIVLHGNLFPLNERATRTIRNLYVENEKFSIEPELRKNRPTKKLLNTKPLQERVYKHEGVAKILRKGDEVGAFNMGSTVVLVFQTPTFKPLKQGESSYEFRFNIRRGDQICVGEALGRWHDL